MSRYDDDTHGEPLVGFALACFITLGLVAFVVLLLGPR